MEDKIKAMMDKVFVVEGKNLMHKDFGDYTPNEEKRLKELLGISDESNEINLKREDNNVVFPLILKAEDIAVDVSKIDFNNVKKDVICDIVTDWIALRFFFTQNSKGYFLNSLQKKIQPIGSTNQNTENRESTLQS